MHVTDAILLITDASSDSPPLDNIRAVMIVWRTIRTVLWSIQGFHASWKVLDFSPKISRTWKVLENEFGPGKS